MGMTSYSEGRRTVLSATPSLANNLNPQQVDELLAKVNMNRSFLQMGTNDQELIELMKDTIMYQTTVIHKR